MKSDDTVGRVKTYEAIVKGENIPTPGVPESFKVLIKELQSLGLDVKVLDQNDEEIDLMQSFDDDDMGLNQGPDVFDEPNVADDLDGYYKESAEGEMEEDEEEDDYSGDFDDEDDEDDFGLGDDGDEDY